MKPLDIVVMLAVGAVAGLLAALLFPYPKWGFAGAIVVGVHPNALVVPVEGVQISSGKRYAYVVRGDKAERRDVVTGVDGGDWLEVASGLAAGDEVVVAGADALSNGATVRVAGRAVPGGTPSAAPAPSERRP